MSTKHTTSSSYEVRPEMINSKATNVVTVSWQQIGGFLPKDFIASTYRGDSNKANQS
jgi:hypothetical protein